MGKNDDILSDATMLLARVGRDTTWEAHCDEFRNNTHMVGAVAKWAAGDLRPTSEDGSVLLWSVFGPSDSSFPVGAEPEARLASMAPALVRLAVEKSATITRLTRERDDLRVDAEVLSDRFAEVRALADAYIDIVNRTARALGIPEVDEDGASPSLHDVPERVGRLVASDAEFRKWVSTGRNGCPPYSSDVAWQLQRLDESFKALHDGAEAVRVERNKLLGDIEMLGYMLGMGPDDDTSPEAVLRFAERLNRGNEPTDDAAQDPPGWSVCGKAIPGTERVLPGGSTTHAVCMDEPGHDGPCRFDARADGGEVGDV